MNFKVYHARELKGGYFRDLPQVTKKSFDLDYMMVARVEALNLEEVFRLTNHIDGSWTSNKGVEAVGGMVRSTSVGDIVQDEKKTYWMCAPMGWEQIHMEA